jgi:protein SCO1/2
MSSRWLLVIAFLAVLSGLAASQLPKQAASKPELEAAVLLASPQTIEKPAAEYQQLLQNKPDHWRLALLGYTSCPDICPTTLLALSRVYQALQEIVPTRVLFITADPGRDNPYITRQYSRYFHADFESLSIDHARLGLLSEQLLLSYEQPRHENGANYYTVVHSAAIAVIAPNGQLFAIIKPSISADQLVHVDDQTLLRDFKKITDYFQKTEGSQ